MTRRFYKTEYTIIVEPPLSEEKRYSNAARCDFGFDGDNVWVKNDVTDNYIFNDDVSQMLKSGGGAVGNKAAVLTYLLAFVGDNTNTASPV